MRSTGASDNLHNSRLGLQMPIMMFGKPGIVVDKLQIKLHQTLLKTDLPHIKLHIPPIEFNMPSIKLHLPYIKFILPLMKLYLS